MAGNIRIIEPTENYQKVSKGIIFNRDIDALTLGIYVKVLCLGKEWELNIQGLANTLNLSDTKIRTAFSLLERAGYVKRVQIKDEKTGYFLGYDYHIGFEPFPKEERTDLVAIHKKESRLPKIQTLENPDSGKSRFREIQTMENREDIYRDNIQDRDNKKNKDNIFIPPTPKEVAEYARSRGFVDPEGFANNFVAYYSEGEKPWHLSNGKPMKDWKRAVITWESNNKDRYFSHQSRQASTQPSRKMKSFNLDDLK